MKPNLFVVESIRSSIGLSVGALLVLTSAALHGQPANDNFVNAGTISGRNGSLAQNTVGATRELGEPNHAGNPGGTSVWFVWEAPASGAAEFGLHSSRFDTVIGAYTGLSLQALTKVAENNDAFDYAPLTSRWWFRGSQSHLRFPARAGVRYYVAVDGARGLAGEFKVGWSLKPPPANDNFASAQVITGANGFIATHNVGATREASEPSHAGNAGSASIWFQWTAPADGSTRFHTLNSLTSSGGPLDTLLAVYVGERLDALTPVACNDNNGTSLRSLVQLDGASDGAGYFSDGWMVMHYNFIPAPILHFTRSGQNLIINWDGPYTLESTSDLGTAWTPVTGTAPVSVSINSEGNWFFRAVHP